jgi:hypothetical protein
VTSLEQNCKTADDLILIEPSGELAENFGITNIRAADFFNLLLQFNNLAGQAPAGGVEDAAAGFGDFDIASFVPALAECGIGILDLDLENFDFAGVVLGCLPVDAVEYLITNDAEFLPNLQPEVFEYFSEDVFTIEGISPPLADVWTTLAQQPQFAQNPLRNTDDIIALGQGSPSQFLNALNAGVPERFAGYEIRLFDSLSIASVSYMLANEPSFFTQLDDEVLLELSPAVLATINSDTLAELETDIVAEVEAIALVNNHLPPNAYKNVTRLIPPPQIQMHLSWVKHGNTSYNLCPVLMHLITLLTYYGFLKPFPIPQVLSTASCVVKVPVLHQRC